MDDEEKDEEVVDMEGDGVDEEVQLNSDGEPIEKEVEEEVEVVAEKPKRPVKPKYLHHPFTEADYAKRQASKEMMRIKVIEDEVLSFKKEGVKTYVISAGVLYGQGEEVFNSHFKKAWL